VTLDNNEQQEGRHCEKMARFRGGVSLDVLGGVWISFAQSSENQSGSTQVADISAKKYEFSPSEIHVRQGTRVELKVHSEDTTHGVKLDIYPEETKDKSKAGLIFVQGSKNGKVAKHVDQILDFVAEEPGTYNFKCAKICGIEHDHMKGKLIVEPQTSQWVARATSASHATGDSTVSKKMEWISCSPVSKSLQTYLPLHLHV
jgi:heme/copper-type cytochrome/quinol oxidase subunit 2